jgi:tetratricopeptide (TPR) repeat protein
MLRSNEERAKKLLFYRDLGREKVKDMPENAQSHFELGVSELENFGDVQNALEAIDRACALDPKFGVAWLFAGICRARLGRFTEALRCFDNAARCGHSTVQLAESTGDARYNLGDYLAAAADYRQGLRRAPGNAALESKLGLSEARSGNPHGGLKKIARAVDKDPSNPELYDRLIAANVLLNRLPAAAAAAEEKLEKIQARPEDFLRAASIWAKLQEWPRAASILQKGISNFPDVGTLRTSLSEIETHCPLGADASIHRSLG